MGRSRLDERETFSAFYVRLVEPVLRYFARRVYDPQLALDLTSETFAQAFVDRQRFKGSDEHAEAAWVFAIARNRLGDYYRRGSVERKALAQIGVGLPDADPQELERVEQLADLACARAAIREGLSELGEDARLALQLRVVEERSYTDVARTLGVSEQTARARVSRALKALSQAIDMDPTSKEIS